MTEGETERLKVSEANQGDVGKGIVRMGEEFLKKMKQFWFDDGLVEICYSTRGGSWQLSKRRPKSPTSESQ